MPTNSIAFSTRLPSHFRHRQHDPFSQLFLPIPHNPSDLRFAPSLPFSILVVLLLRSPLTFLFSFPPSLSLPILHSLPSFHPSFPFPFPHAFPPSPSASLFFISSLVPFFPLLPNAIRYISWLFYNFQWFFLWFSFPIPFSSFCRKGILVPIPFPSIAFHHVFRVFHSFSFPRSCPNFPAIFGYITPFPLFYCKIFPFDRHLPIALCKIIHLWKGTPFSTYLSTTLHRSFSVHSDFVPHFPRFSPPSSSPIAFPPGSLLVFFVIHIIANG